MLQLELNDIVMNIHEFIQNISEFFLWLKEITKCSKKGVYQFIERNILELFLLLKKIAKCSKYGCISSLKELFQNFSFG